MNFLSVEKIIGSWNNRSAVGKNIVGELWQHNTVCDSGTNQFKRGSIVGTFAVAPSNKGTLNQKKPEVKCTYFIPFICPFIY